MIPANVERFKTEGERQSYPFKERNAYREYSKTPF